MPEKEWMMRCFISSFWVGLVYDAQVLLLSLTGLTCIMFHILVVITSVDVEFVPSGQEFKLGWVEVNTNSQC